MTYRERKDVKFSFYCHEKQSAELKIRLKYDNLRQTEFFLAILDMYTSQDPLMVSIVEKIKTERRCMGRASIKRSKEDYLAGTKLLRDLGISEQDKEDIFDIIEMDLEEHYE